MFVALHLSFLGLSEYTINKEYLIDGCVKCGLIGCSYAMISFVASTIRGAHHHQHVNHGVRSHSTPGKVFDMLNGFGTVAFAFAGHSVALEIQATIPSPPEKPSKVAMWKGIVVAYIIVPFCYLAVAISGLWAFGNVVEDDVFISLEKTNWLVALANIMLFFHVIGSYQVKQNCCMNSN
ncbi:unnamed protein product [Prunus armeniaca]|uniref:Amino acid transporter transmembrane domain-containing protein n=1 Tax=Prunus armeniaca TaxID=36596 RepID=A0A6J5WN69_PRUAR|nr:unnamed protein product [Prunus armeniaca]